MSDNEIFDYFLIANNSNKDITQGKGVIEGRMSKKEFLSSNFRFFLALTLANLWRMNWKEVKGGYGDNFGQW